MYLEIREENYLKSSLALLIVTYLRGTYDSSSNILLANIQPNLLKLRAVQPTIKSFVI